ncbi:MAG: IPT/TIG domain-containing protein [Bacteroidota bacterium]
MRPVLTFKNLFLAISMSILSSCESFEDVIPASDFQPLKNTTVTPANDVYYGQKIVIKGEKFIKNKAYTQVWFGDVRANIDSYNETTINVTIPNDAKTGILSVSNGVYADTIEQNFRILKRNMIIYHNLDISFGGGLWSQRVISKNGRREGSGEYKSTSIDTAEYYGKFTLTSNDTVTRHTTNSFGCALPSDSFTTDSAYYTVPFISYTASPYGGDRTLNTIQMDVDTNNRIFKNLTFRQIYSDYGYDAGYSFELCKRLQITFINLPYSAVGNKKVVSIQSNELKQYIIDFAADSSRLEHKNSPIFNQTHFSYKGLVKVYPSSYFNMTLE